MPRGVQNQVNGVPAPAVAGDFASANWNRYSVVAGPGALVAGSAGVTVGAFAWISDQSIDPDNAAQIVNSFGAQSLAPDGFVTRPDSPAIITTYLADGTMVIAQGLPVPLHSSGDFWCVNGGSAINKIGDKAYANLATGLVSFGATGSPSTASDTGGAIAAGTWSATGSINGNVMTVGTVTGTYGVPIGATVTGTNVATGTVVVAQLTGPARGAGTYAVSVPEQTVASGTSLSGTFGVLTAGTVTGTILNGAVVAGAGITATFITDTLGAGNTNLTGAGGAGTYVVNKTQSVASEAVTYTTNVETKWIARSRGAAGELVKISEIVQ
jgi:hypothetical protein